MFTYIKLKSPDPRFQLRKALSQLQRLSSGANGLICTPAPSKSAGTQTEFPAAMLEDYVVKNRKRILKLLGIVVPPQGSGGELLMSMDLMMAS